MSMWRSRKNRAGQIICLAIVSSWLLHMKAIVSSWLLHVLSSCILHMWSSWLWCRKNRSWHDDLLISAFFYHTVVRIAVFRTNSEFVTLHNKSSWLVYMYRQVQNDSQIVRHALQNAEHWKHWDWWGESAYRVRGHAWTVLWCALQCVAVCCKICCSVLQCVAKCKICLPCAVTRMDSFMMCVAVCCSVLQCVAVCCSELQWVAGSELQWVAVWCSVLQCLAVSCSVL